MTTICCEFKRLWAVPWNLALVSQNFFAFQIFTFYSAATVFDIPYDLCVCVKIPFAKMLSHLVKGYRHLISKTVSNNKELCCIAQQNSHTFAKKVNAATLHFDYFASSVDDIPISSW